jgi:hypothetical protein
MPLKSRQASVTTQFCLRLKGSQQDRAASGTRRMTLLSCLALASINSPKRQDDWSGFVLVLM